jgi:hypothetical protein
MLVDKLSANADIELVKHPDQPLVDMHDGTQFVNQPDQLVRNIYDDTQFVNHPNQLAGNIYDGTQFGSHLDQPVGNIYDGKEHGHGDEFSNQGDDEDDRDDQGFQIEDDYEMLIPEDGKHQMKKKPPCFNYLCNQCTSSLTLRVRIPCR